MVKTIVVWGINEAILQSIKSNIDPRKAKIIFFIDSDKTKVGKYYMGIPVVEWDAIEISKVDYFFITAFSAYIKIRKDLIEYGVEKEKIQLFVTKALCEHCCGDLEDIDIEVIRNLYFEPEKAIGYVTCYKKAYREYQMVSKCEEIAEAWYNRSTLISHACGGVVNGKQIKYSNSKEAFQYSVDNGFELIECDLMFCGDKELVLAHEYEDFYRAKEERYSIMTARELLNKLKLYPHVKCLLDVKWDKEEDYAKCLCEIKRIIEEICKNIEECERLKKQIIMEVYDEATIVLALKENFEMIFTQYRNPNKRNHMEIVALCNKYNIKAIAMSNKSYVYQRKFTRIITDKNIKIFVFSTNSVDEYVRLKDVGITGIFTDYLTKKDIEEGNVK